MKTRKWWICTDNGMVYAPSVVGVMTDKLSIIHLVSDGHFHAITVDKCDDIDKEIMALADFVDEARCKERGNV